ncbi:uncharacterized protein [Engystomops pustulosus]|uniref:uncharacterized protein isoform X2 n=1 Tax=Engystomops pustulosus TaxID=76066 RepID=UPI003AFB243E
MMGCASTGQTVNLDMCAPLAEGRPTGQQNVLKRIRGVVGGTLDMGVTPVKLLEMEPYLSRYPELEKATLLRGGFGEGFRIPAPRHAVPFTTRNLKSAYQYPGVVRKKLSKEVELGRMAGPFADIPIAGLIVSPLGVVPKKEANKFRLIHHLSYPKGLSVNDGISPEVCTVAYTSFDKAVEWVRKYGRGALLAKMDIESAFRLLPVHRDSLRLLGCFWESAFYVDRCLPMELLFGMGGKAGGKGRLHNSLLRRFFVYWTWGFQGLSRSISYNRVGNEEVWSPTSSRKDRRSHLLSGFLGDHSRY